ncbi:MAG TPA: helix-hairpin-helix domain-containing protein [Anaerolineales bacterium]|nr:helix-hairpin-helix domain-containing protein [Anaerolineales bacterium]
MRHSRLTLAKAAITAALAVALVACSNGAAPAVSGNTSGSANSAVSTTTLNVDSETSVTKFNLNTASADDFLTIPGVGNRMVREFLEYRPYTSIVQFRREIGKYVDAAQVAEYEQYVFVPVDVNQADAETLKQLPGVDDAIAAELIAGRPYASHDAFLTKLVTYVSAAQLDTAKSYLATQ